jgi:multiple antibiotic resistance protein
MAILIVAVFPPRLSRYSAGITRAERSNLARRIAVNAGLVLIIAMWAGTALLSGLGIGIAALRIGGGLVVAAQAWHLLGETSSETLAFGSSSPNAASIATLVPLTIPFTTGPGTLAAAIALGAARPDSGADQLAYLFGMSAAAIALAALVALLYGSADRALEWLGREKSQALARLSAFALLCVGIQILVTGLSAAWS